jgi:hypothetical protein
LIDFRYHIVSLVAVFLALALGLFLGSTTLQSTVTHNLHKQADAVLSQNRHLSAQGSQYKSERDALAGFADAVEPYAVAGRLAGGSVALVSAPGVDSGVRQQLTQTLSEAGATVSADISLQSAFLDPTQDAELGQLASELAQNRPLPRQNGATQASYELARALLTRPAARLVSRGRIATILTTLVDGKMISVSGRLPVHQADLAIVLVPASPAAGSTATAASDQDGILISLAEQLRAASSGVVVAGPTIPPDSAGGSLAAARDDSTLTKTVSTVDSIDTASGRIATVIALAAAPSARVGRFGSASHDSPLLSPSPAP